MIDAISLDLTNVKFKLNFVIGNHLCMKVIEICDHSNHLWRDIFEEVGTQVRVVDHLKGLLRIRDVEGVGVGGCPGEESSSGIFGFVHKGIKNY